MNKNKHEETVDMVVERLLSTGKFNNVQTDIEYSHPLGCGQVDVLSFISPNHHYFYEVKSTGHPRAIKRAQEQYNRYKITHKTQNIEGYVCFTKDDKLVIERLPE